MYTRYGISENLEEVQRTRQETTKQELVDDMLTMGATLKSKYVCTYKLDDLQQMVQQLQISIKKDGPTKLMKNG